jgi:hypothetical protein
MTPLTLPREPLCSLEIDGRTAEASATEPAAVQGALWDLLGWRMRADAAITVRPEGERQHG